MKAQIPLSHYLSFRCSRLLWILHSALLATEGWGSAAFVLKEPDEPTFCLNPYIMVLGWMNRKMLTCAALWWKGHSLRFRTTGVPFLAQKTDSVPYSNTETILNQGVDECCLQQNLTTWWMGWLGWKEEEKKPFSSSRRTWSNEVDAIIGFEDV